MAKIDLIISDIRQRIRGARYQPGDMIPTQKELAAELGVSVVTIGQALRYLQEEGILASTRGKGTIVKALPNPSGEELSAYGLLITTANIHDPILARPMAALQKACTAHGYELRIHPCGNVKVSRKQLSAWAEGVKAFFVLGATQPEFAQRLKALGKPVIFYGETYREPCPPWAGQVSVSIEVIALMSLQHLINMGHRHILLVRSKGSSYLESLGNAFNHAAGQLGISDALQQFMVSLDTNGEELVDALRGEFAQTTAVVIDGGMRASRIYMTLVRNGISIPDQLSLMAINGVNRDLLITPDLTRIESLDFHLGEQLLRVATEMLENGIVIRERLVPYLIPGKTCRQIG